MSGGKAPQDTHDTIPLKKVWKDGIALSGRSHYTKTFVYGDLNFKLAGRSMQNAIFEKWCDFLNYYDNSISLQMTFLNLEGKAEYSLPVILERQGDERDTLVDEFGDILKMQFEKGNNGFTKTKYITVGVEAETLPAAKMRLQHIESEVLGNFKALGVTASTLNGKERLELLYRCMNGGNGVFNYDWDLRKNGGMDIKDVIAPDSFQFGKQGRTFRMGAKSGCVSFLQIMANDFSDRILTDFLDLQGEQIVSLHIRALDQQDAMKMVKRKISDIQAMTIDEQKKAVKSGYDYDVIPYELKIKDEESKTLLKDLGSRNERLFLVTVILTNLADNPQKLENEAKQAAGIAGQHNCNLRRLGFQQEQGLISSLPLGLNQIDITRMLTTSSTAIFLPFTTQELMMGGRSLYYGLNAMSRNVILADRNALNNPNGLILGTPGSGKSFAAKREILMVFIITNDDIVLMDPENEYLPLVNALGGQVIKISPSSGQFINPLDININYGDEDNPVRAKSDFILSLCAQMLGGKDALVGPEKSIIDQAVQRVYERYFLDPKPENMPILQDLYDIIKQRPEPEARHIVASLEFYVTGSMNFFNNRTNVDATNRMVCYDIKDLGKNLKELGMLVVQDAIWNRVSNNRAAGKKTRLFIDEFHLLLREASTAAYCFEFWKRFRKWGGIPTGITQNVNDFLLSREVENILSNSPFILMLDQAAADQEVLADKLNISPSQLEYVTNARPGSGLIYFEGNIIPFFDEFPVDTKIFKLINTKPEENNPPAKDHSA